MTTEQARSQGGVALCCSEHKATRACCTREPPANRIAPPCHTLRRRLASTTGVLAPGAALILLPKCPVCLAAYIALWTGIGISVPAAAWIRPVLIALCIAAILFVLAAQARRLTRRHRAQQPHQLPSA